MVLASIRFAFRQPACGSQVFSPGILWIGSKMSLSGSDVQILAMYS